MDYFFEPKSIVIYGASENTLKSGNHVLKNVLNYKRENIYLIHPMKDYVYGIRCYRSIFDLPIQMVDLSIIILPVEFVFAALLDCLDFGVSGIIIESGAIYLTNDFETLEKIHQLKKNYKDNYKSRIMGPNSIGIYNAFENGIGFTTSLIHFKRFPELKEKNLSMISQTGLTLSGLLFSQNNQQEVGISKIASIGNKFDINESDLLDYLEEDKNTNVIAFYLEDISEGRKFVEQCKRISKKKPLILLKSGISNKAKKAIISHTGSIAGNYKNIQALSTQFGIILVEDFAELFNVGKCLLNQPIPKGNRIGVISISGAGTVLSCDFAMKYNLELPKLSSVQLDKLKSFFPEFAWKDINNPIDIWSAVEKVGPEKAYMKSGEILLKENTIDILVYFLTGIKETEFDWRLLYELNQQYPEIPIYFGLIGGDKKILRTWRKIIEVRYNIPMFFSISNLFKTISKIMIYVNYVSKEGTFLRGVTS
ncbi:MAG: hypothetical protein GF317_12755 [Candidatus Lokiarchaeota archaeon]|nr:hypothetical protein [Candidatus Lokiarchaeota archaeon]MBD3200511.1 hypothetical protein [Candidatus Lokiarchaeota archaeon]